MSNCNYCDAEYTTELDMKFHLIETHRFTAGESHRIVRNWWYNKT